MNYSLLIPHCLKGLDHVKLIKLHVKQQFIKMRVIQDEFLNFTEKEMKDSTL